MRKVVLLVILHLTIITLSAQPLSRHSSIDYSAPIIGEQSGKMLASPKLDEGYQFTKGTFVFNAGISAGLIGYPNYGYVGGTGFLPVTLSGEYSLNELIGVSAYFGFYGRSYDGGALKYNVTTFGGRLVFHATDLLNDKLKIKLPERLDLYATLILGYRVYSWSTNNGTPLPSNTGNVTFGPAIGARYMVIKNFGVYAELGRGPFGVLGTGLSVKF